jgi:hypothetical protein
VECCLAGFQGSLKTQFLQTSMSIVALDEGIDGLTPLLQVAEDPTVDGLFLEGAVEPKKGSWRGRKPRNVLI